MRHLPCLAKTSPSCKKMCKSSSSDLVPLQMEWACTCTGKTDVVHFLKPTRASVCMGGYVAVRVCMDVCVCVGTCVCACGRVVRGCLVVCLGMSGCLGVWAYNTRKRGTTNCQEANTTPDQHVFHLRESQRKEFQ